MAKDSCGCVLESTGGRGQGVATSQVEPAGKRRRTKSEQLQKVHSRRELGVGSGTPNLTKVFFPELCQGYGDCSKWVSEVEHEWEENVTGQSKRIVLKEKEPKKKKGKKADSGHCTFCVRE